jgi:hypothetical protein
MSDDQIRDDLAFMRSIVASGDESLVSFGRIYFAAGLCYGGQCLGTGLQMLAGLDDVQPLSLVLGVGPTVLFALLLAWLIWKDRGEKKPANSTTRAIGIVFGAAGLTNLALIFSIGSIAAAQHSLIIWLIYPCVVMILQGMAWMVAWTLRREVWLGIVAAGWFVVGCAMAIALAANNLDAFIVIISIGLFAFMAWPGARLMRRRSTAS